MPCCSIFIFSIGIRLVLIFQPHCSRAYFSSLVGIAPDPFQAAAPQFCSASSCLDFRGLDFSVDLSSHLVFCFGSLLRDFSPSSVFGAGLQSSIPSSVSTGCFWSRCWRAIIQFLLLFFDSCAHRSFPSVPLYTSVSSRRLLSCCKILLLVILVFGSLAVCVAVACAVVFLSAVRLARRENLSWQLFSLAIVSCCVAAPSPFA
jgi:hypothetical protein